MSPIVPSSIRYESPYIALGSQDVDMDLLVVQRSSIGSRAEFLLAPKSILPILTAYLLPLESIIGYS